MSRVIHSQVAVDFLSRSETLSLCFDGSEKKGEAVQAIVAVNERSEKLALAAFVQIEKDAVSTAQELYGGLVDVALDADEMGLTLPGEFETVDDWFRSVLSKVVTLLSDSCNVAKDTASELKTLIEDYTEFEGQNIAIYDCSMHLICNFERKMLKQLKPEPRDVLKLISELFGSRTKIAEALTILHPELRGQFSRQVGVRFGNGVQNAITLLVNWDTIQQFLEPRHENPSCFTLFGYLRDHTTLIKYELGAFCFVWYNFVAKVWDRLRTNRDLHASRQVVTQWSLTGENVIDGGQVIDTILDDNINPFNSFEASTEAEGRRTDQITEFVREFAPHYAYFDEVAKKMIDAGRTYVTDLTREWAADAPELPGLNLNNQVHGLKWFKESHSDFLTISPISKIPYISNHSKVTESFFSILDTVVKYHQGKKMASRLTLALCKFNNVYDLWVKGATLDEINSLMVKRSKCLARDHSSDMTVAERKLEREERNERAAQATMNEIEEISIMTSYYGWPIQADRTHQAWREFFVGEREQYPDLKKATWINAVLLRIRNDYRVVISANDPLLRPASKNFPAYRAERNLKTLLQRHYAQE